MALLIAVALLIAQTGPITWPPGKIVLMDDGTTCTFAFGATFAVQGARGDYSCEDGPFQLHIAANGLALYETERVRYREPYPDVVAPEPFSLSVVNG